MSGESFRERRKGDICECGHHMDSHEDGWQSCSECECNPYTGPVTRWDSAIDGPNPLLALIKKDTTF